MKTLNKLRKEEHPVIDKIISGVNGETLNVSEDYFGGTVFLNEYDFINSQKMISDFIVGSVKKPMIETPLIEEKGNNIKLYVSPKGKGIGFGLIFIDYRKKNPLLVLYVDKTQTGYSYESARFDNGTWVDGLSLNFNASTLKEFLEDISENLDNDVRFFTNKY